MPPAVTTLETPTEYAQELLDLCVAALAETVGGAMTSQKLVHGTPVHECDMVSVAVASLGDASFPAQSTVGAGQRHITGALNLYGFRVTTVRCMPVIDEAGNPPSDDEETAAATKQHQDLIAVWNAVRQAKRDDSIFGGACDLLFFDGARSLEVEGGYAGWEIDFRADISGFVAVGT
jgi:hypothetical protein